MKLFWSYLCSRKGTVFLFALWEGIFAGVLYLYRVPGVAIAYPAALCAGVGIVALAADFFRVRRVHRELDSFQNADDVATRRFPEAEGPIHSDYQRIVASLSATQRAANRKRDEGYRNMLDYFTVWAHQIKTPISSMDLRLQREDSVLSRQLSGDLNRVEQYVQMAMTFLRLDSEATDYTFREQDLDGIVRQSLHRFAGEFISRKLSLRYEPLNTRVVTDEKWLNFVVEQVLSNALKYTPSGEIHIYLEKPCALCIADTGIGIAPEDVPRIFEKGFTGFNGRADHRATGLGLYLCKRILTNLGHTISAESQPGQGTTVRIDLSQRQGQAE